MRKAMLLFVAVFLTLAGSHTAAAQALGWVGRGIPGGPCSSGTVGIDLNTGLLYGCGDLGWASQASGPFLASNVNFQNSAAGAIQRTVQAKFNEEVSVTDFSGADPTGSTDSTSAFAAAIEWAGTNPSPTGMTGGTINIPCGRYKVNPTVSFMPYSGTVFRGGGKNCVFIVYTGTSTNPVWDVNSFNNGTRGLNIEWNNLTMLGNNTTPGSVCYHFGTPNNSTGKVQNITFINVKVTQCGIAVQLDDVWNFSTFNTQIIFNLGDGLKFTDPDAITGVYLYGTRIGNNGGHGINNAGAGVVTQLEQSQGEDTYNATGDVVAGIARDWAFYGVWFEDLNPATAQNAIDVTGAQGILVDDGHFNFPLNSVFASAPVSYITMRNSATSNGQSAMVNVPAGSTNITYSENNRSNVPSTVGPNTAQYTVGCPGSSDLALTSGTGLSVNACTGNNIQTWGANAALEAVLSNVGNLSLKGGLLSLSGSAFGQFTTGTSAAGMTQTRNVADAFAAGTTNNANAGSSGDIYDFQSQGTNQDGFTVQGIEFHRVGSAIASAATIAPIAPTTHITGTTPISTITPPTNCTNAAESGCTIQLIFDGAGSFTTGGNMSKASTLSAGQLVIVIFDPSQSKWYPSI